MNAHTYELYTSICGNTHRLLSQIFYSGLACPAFQKEYEGILSRTLTMCAKFEIFPINKYSLPYGFSSSYSNIGGIYAPGFKSSAAAAALPAQTKFSSFLSELQRSARELTMELQTKIFAAQDAKDIGFMLLGIIKDQIVKIKENMQKRLERPLS